MSNKWDKRFIEMTREVASWSSCLRRNVGAVIVKGKRIIATGYNGAPEGVETCLSKKTCLRDELHIESGTKHEFCYANHAEQNAMLQAAKLGISLQNATMYCSHKPCAICLKMIVNSGIKEVVYENDYQDPMADEILRNLSDFKIRQYHDERAILLSDFKTRNMVSVDIVMYILRNYANMTGAEANELIDNLDKLNFFMAPASCSHHLAYAEGLFEHSFNVAMNLYEFTKQNHLTWEKRRSPILIGLLHDLCKCDQYVKLSTDGYAWNKSADSRHGIKSVEIARILVPDLTDEEAACIEFHMGAFTDKSQWNAYSGAGHKYPNVYWTHQADMIATNVNEVEK